MKRTPRFRFLIHGWAIAALLVFCCDARADLVVSPTDSPCEFGFDPSCALPMAAGLAGNPDLIYDPTTGNVSFDADGGEFISFSLDSSGEFIAAAADYSDLNADIGGGFVFEDKTASTLGWVSVTTTPFNGTAGSVNTPIANIGAVFPTGLDADGLATLLTKNEFAHFLGGVGVTGSFDLVVSPVPEPSAFLFLSFFGLSMTGRKYMKAWSSGC